MKFQRKTCVYLKTYWNHLQITYKLSEDYLSEARKETTIQGGKDSLHGTTGSISIQCYKIFYVNYTSNDHIKRYLKQKCAEEPGTSQIKRSSRFQQGYLILRNTVLYVVNIVTLLKTETIEIDEKRTKVSVAEQQTGKKGIYLLKKNYCS